MNESGEKRDLDTWNFASKQKLMVCGKHPLCPKIKRELGLTWMNGGRRLPFVREIRREGRREGWARVRVRRVRRVRPSPQTTQSARKKKKVFPLPLFLFPGRNYEVIQFRRNIISNKMHS